MTFNSPAIIQNIRADFEKMLEFGMGEEAQKATADHIERGLFKLLIALGAKLLILFFVMRSQACSRKELILKEGGKLPYHRDTQRSYFSIFCKLVLWRPNFYKKGMGGQAPLDAELSLGDDCYSDCPLSNPCCTVWPASGRWCFWSMAVKWDMSVSP